MSMEIAIARYRLLFKHPFGTSHGLRDGTDAVFIRVIENGCQGYGEVTLPPYLKETIDAVIQRLKSIAGRHTGTAAELLEALDGLPEFQVAASGPPFSGCRAGLHMALIDLLGKQLDRSARTLIGTAGDRAPITLVTIGTSSVDQVVVKLKELPTSGALKVKVSGLEDRVSVDVIKQLDNRKIFIDGNQGIRSVDEAVELANAAGDRLLAVEEPFGPDHRKWNKELSERLGAVVYADEAVQRLEDIATAASWYGGINIKLMKCGGLDKALASAVAARANGLNVMLGSMSESSLGCTAMAQLAGEADLVDLDGPWLLKNDPFQGMAMVNGGLVLPDRSGLGAVLRTELPFGPVCA